jgi:hypothetical protein
MSSLEIKLVELEQKLKGVNYAKDLQLSKNTNLGIDMDDINNHRSNFGKTTRVLEKKQIIDF